MVESIIWTVQLYRIRKQAGIYNFKVVVTKHTETASLTTAIYPTRTWDEGRAKAEECTKVLDLDQWDDFTHFLSDL